MNYVGVDYGAWGTIIASVLRLPRFREESNVVSFPHNDQSDLGKWADLQILACGYNAWVSTTRNDEGKSRTLELLQLCVTRGK